MKQPEINQNEIKVQTLTEIYDILGQSEELQDANETISIELLTEKIALDIQQKNRIDKEAIKKMIKEIVY